MNRFLQITVIVIVVILALLIIVPSLMIAHKPAMADLIEQCTLAPEETSMTAQELYDRIQSLLPYPQDNAQEESQDGSQMQIYADGDPEGEEPLDTLSVAQLENGVQYEYYDSAANILYRCTAGPKATPDRVTPEDLAQAGITALDMTKFRELMG